MTLIDLDNKMDGWQCEIAGSENLNRHQKLVWLLYLVQILVRWILYASISGRGWQCLQAWLLAIRVWRWDVQLAFQRRLALAPAIPWPCSPALRHGFSIYRCRCHGDRFCCWLFLFYLLWLDALRRVLCNLVECHCTRHAVLQEYVLAFRHVLHSLKGLNNLAHGGSSFGILAQASVRKACHLNGSLGGVLPFHSWIDNPEQLPIVHEEGTCPLN